MSRAVSVVLPALGTPELFEENLPPLLDELRRRDAGDEVIVVDDTGRGELAPWLAERFPGVAALTREKNGGFAAALTSGVERAANELVLSLNTDIRVRPGFLEPLIEVLADDVLGAVPKVLLGGREDRIESLTELELNAGNVEVRQAWLAPELRSGSPEPPAEPPPEGPAAVAFAVGGAFLFRRAELLERGFDPMYQPFYWEDVDLCWRAWREGRRVLYQPASVVEHRHRGTIGGLVPEKVFRAAIEKNRLLFQWKHLEGALLRDHLAALYRQAVDAWVLDDHRELLWLNLALEQMDAALSSRASAGGTAFDETRRKARPV